MKQLYQMTHDELFKAAGADEKGLSSEKAAEVLREKGPNALEEGRKKTTLQVFLEQFKDFLVVILVIAAVISMMSGNIESTAVILVVLVLNAVLGTVQYVKAEKSLDSLKALSSPYAKVIRNGEKTEIPSQEVVPGDILLLEAGDMVTADGRILYNYSLQVNESSLTGESANVDKSDRIIDEDVPLADRKNMVYSGTLVTYGRATVLVTSTGMSTEMGKIAGLMNETREKKTPLQISLDDFSKKLAAAIMVICAVVFLLSVYRDMGILDSMMFAVALAVAAIPEALSSIVTIVQAMGTQKMAEDNAIMKELKAVESLGCVSVICSDKTGTLTKNEMTVQEIYIDSDIFRPEEMNPADNLHRKLLYTAVLDNDSSFSDGKGIGDPTEYCLLTMSDRAGLLHTDIRSGRERLEEVPFDSDRKLMSVKYSIDGVKNVFTKGAVDVIMGRTVNIATKSGVRPITEEDRKTVLERNQRFSENGLRVLALAYKEVDDSDVLTADTENGYTFLGLVSITDPPREESAAAVADAQRAGIKPIMITGDHKVTATAIAKQIGIFHEGDMAMTGQEVDALSDPELDSVLEKVSVYARVSPENKIRIVDAWQRKGNIVAMTGDGVNDAPALKKADIGVAMGITGTEVSKDAAAMILSDDNFATIIKAVENGRNVYRNIRNAIQFLLSGNMAGILTVLFCSLFALPAPFAPVHLLFMNLVTDSLPALAIGMEGSDKGLLDEKPRNPNTGILTRGFALHLFGYGALIAVATLASFYRGLETDIMTATTMAFATLTLARLFHGFNCRSEKPLSRIGLGSNKWSILAFLTGAVLLGLVLCVPFLKRLFLIADLAAGQMIFIAVASVLPSLFIQLYKMIKSGKSR